ncbi:uncharacterized protein LOC111411394, partial [Olea europaea var. sylvestris]|uniref:uncharacterized protein LOC111411394 n=1 Tax=Olea europaea var. sylvestris TaxID=158386 RepID=UPI000C1D7015
MFQNEFVLGDPLEWKRSPEFENVRVAQSKKFFGDLQIEWVCPRFFIPIKSFSRSFPPLPNLKLPNPEQIKGKKYYKWHNAWSHLTNNCLIFRHVLQDAIESGRITFDDKKKMAVDEDPFPQSLEVNMVTSGFKNKLPKFKLVIDDGEEDTKTHPSVFERIKGKEPKKDEDVLCAR